MKRPGRKSVADWNGRTVDPGKRKRLRIEISESFSGSTVQQNGKPTES